MNEEITRVKFYNDGGEILAVFPELIADDQGNLTGYMHMGQHTAVNPGYLRYKRRAKPAEYFNLYKELVNLGYQLEVI